MHKTGCAYSPVLLNVKVFFFGGIVGSCAPVGPGALAHGGPLGDPVGWQVRGELAGAQSPAQGRVQPRRKDGPFLALGPQVQFARALPGEIVSSHPLG